MIQEILDKIDTLDKEDTKKIIELLIKYYEFIYSEKF